MLFFKGSKLTEFISYKTNYYRKIYIMKISDNYCTKGLTCQRMFGNEWDSENTTVQNIWKPFTTKSPIVKECLGQSNFRTS